jgi:hypothetical protein
VLFVATNPANVTEDVAAFFPAILLKTVLLSSNDLLPKGVLRIKRHQHADVSHTVDWLRVYRERQSDRGAPKQSDELASCHGCPSNGSNTYHITE